MTVLDVIQALLKRGDLNRPCMVLDGFNGSGTPREINLGPVERTVTAEDAEASADCEGLEGQTVVVVGFGCY